MSLETYGRYQLLKKLATGGMAQIYLARQLGVQGFEKLLVVKRILPHLAENEDFITMFLDEARIAARLNHPNVVQIFDLGQQDDTFYIAMEYIHGEDVRKVWKQAERQGTAIPIPLICRIIIESCSGLDYAHKKPDPAGRPLNIVHRDISPQNILVSFEGGVKVVDFGIAKAADQATVTKSGVLKGKYSYMSPEQAQGKPVDARTDVFALGVVLYELLTGARLFKRANDIQTLNAVTECQVEPPSHIDARLPKDLDAIVMRALARDPAARFPTARDMALAIESALDVAAPAEVGEWVQCKAQGAIAARDALVARIEATPPANEKGDEPVPSGPQERRGRLPALALVPLALLILLGLGWRLSTQPGASSSTPGPAAPLPRPSAAPSPSPSPTTLSQPEPSAPLASSSAAPSSAPSTRRPFPSSRPKPVAPDFL